MDKIKPHNEKKEKKKRRERNIKHLNIGFQRGKKSLPGLQEFLTELFFFTSWSVEAARGKN